MRGERGQTLLVCGIAVGFFALFAACVVYASFARGIWLDEFWSLRLSDGELPLPQLIRDRWLSDTHPPLANLLYWLVDRTGARSIEARRLALNLPALGLYLAATLAFIRWSWRASQPLVIALLSLSLPGAIAAFADLRSYGWQVVAVGTFLQYIAFLARVHHDRRRAPHVVGLTALFAAVTLHYVTGLIVSGLVVALGWHFWHAGRRRAALRIFGVASLGWTAMLAAAVFLALRLRRDVDVGWIATSTPTALALFGYLALTVLLANPLVAFFALKRRHDALADSASIVRPLAVGAVLTMAGLIMLNAMMPIIVERYLLGWQLTLCAILTALAAPALARPAPALVVALIAALMAIVQTVDAVRATGWRENADRVAVLVARCPATSVLAMSAWRLKPSRTSNMARRETAVIDAGYVMLARQRNFAVRMLPLAAPVELRPGPVCPTVLWTEHLDGDAPVEAAAFLRGARVAVPAGTTLRIEHSPSGLLVIAGALPPATAAQNRRAIPK